MSSDAAEELIFHQTDEFFYFEPVSSKNLLIINRHTNEVCLEDNIGQVPYVATRRNIFGIVGIIRLISGPYVVVITKRVKIGTLSRQTIWRISETEVIPYTKSKMALTAEQQGYNDKYLSMVQQTLATPYFYFSYAYDVTHTLQRLYYTTEDFMQVPLHERADVRFVWNHHLMRDLVFQPSMSQFCLPIMHGFISIKQCSINGEWFQWAIISRRSVYRAGVRMWTRGIDQDGYVANYVETEQIIEYKDFRSSFVQTRGSIPLFWTQEPNLKYKPSPKILDIEHEEPFSRHFETQVLTYGKVVIINLIDQKGGEAKLQEAFRNYVEHTTQQMVKDNVRYEYFDFHHECRQMRWDRLSLLMDRLAPEQETLGFFLYRDGVVLQEQEGVFRTNCIDCLDRTNVVQSMLARRQLQTVLSRMSILQQNQLIEEQIAFEALFKNVWADNADIVSTQYSGTGALKTDFTRTGKRSKRGVLQDGINSAIRYVKNNFFDGERQDSIDLFLGKYQVEPGEGIACPCPLRDIRESQLFVWPLAVFFSLLVVFATLLLPSEYTTFTFLTLLLSAAVTVVAVMGTMQRGRQLVNEPKLCSDTLNSLVSSSKES